MEVYNKDLLLNTIKCQIQKSKKQLVKNFRDLEKSKKIINL